MEIVDFTKCCYTYNSSMSIPIQQCGRVALIKGFCDECVNIHYVPDELLLYENFVGKNKIVFEQCLNINKNLLPSLINNINDFDIFGLSKHSSYNKYHRVMKTDMTYFKKLIVQTVFSYIPEKIFLMNCIIENYERGILDVKYKFIIHNMTLENLIYK